MKVSKFLILNVLLAIFSISVIVLFRDGGYLNYYDRGTFLILIMYSVIFSVTEIHRCLQISKTPISKQHKETILKRFLEINLKGKEKTKKEEILKDFSNRDSSFSEGKLTIYSPTVKITIHEDGTFLFSSIGFYSGGGRHVAIKYATPLILGFVLFISSLFRANELFPILICQTSNQFLCLNEFSHSLLFFAVGIFLFVFSILWMRKEFKLSLRMDFSPHSLTTLSKIPDPQGTRKHHETRARRRFFIFFVPLLIILFIIPFVFPSVTELSNPFYFGLLGIVTILVCLLLYFSYRTV